ncbi:PfkB family carbohydrate kinase [Streptomyces sp. NBC_01795]|uniref:PfkB family carbohydrate kinase n=1 Tax=Streptomyces sp. NBC_01795 TaxID=2975943 RepID=UPI002DDC79E7|nr:PfkB family carbohydrate kinase [Streptomyces sp. NBC_01795]WSA91312.1 PfkB family carbohydrate kinase [Streptomyces sp. NBC_01795]
MRRVRLLGIGDNVVDRYAGLASPQGPDADGVDPDPDAGGPAPASDGTMFPGGNAVNVAVYAARAGAEAAYWGVTGDDPAGEVVRAGLRAEGVDLSRVRTAHGTNAWAEVGLTGGDRVFKGSDDGVSVFSLGAAGLEALGTYDLVHTAYSGSLVPQVPDMAARTRVSFDFSYHWREPWAERLLPHLYLAAFSTSQLSDAESARLLRDATHQGTRWALATRGAEGAVLTDGTTFWHRSAARTEAVDTLGAGDAFIGTLLVTLAAGGDPEAGLADAAEAAARACTAHGGFGRGAPLAGPTPVPPRVQAGTP